MVITQRHLRFIVFLFAGAAFDVGGCLLWSAATLMIIIQWHQVLQGVDEIGKAVTCTTSEEVEFS